jgi:hypothetical protein
MNEALFREIIGDLLESGIILNMTTSTGYGGMANGEDGRYFIRTDESMTAFIIELVGPVNISVAPDLSETYKASFINDIVQQSANHLNDTLILAHEFGHHKSNMEGFRCSGYENAINVPSSDWKDTLSDYQKDLIYTEEVRAWKYARSILESKRSFARWDEFDMKSYNSLSIYRILLDI